MVDGVGDVTVRSSYGRSGWVAVGFRAAGNSYGWVSMNFDLSDPGFLGAAVDYVLVRFSGG